MFRSKNNNSFKSIERDVGYIFIEEAESLEKEVFLREDDENNDTPLRKPPLKTPNAPIKQCNKKFEKIQIKPKKLIYLEEDIDQTGYDKMNQENKKSLSTSIRLMPQRKAKSKITSLNEQSRSKTNIPKSTMPKSLPYKGFNSNVPLSQAPIDTSREAKLLWLQPRRDVGLWIECCYSRCKKFRFCEDYHDPLDVPEVWYCEMNSDKTIAACEIPEVPIDPSTNDDLIENKYNAGSVVWARTKGCPWFPAMVDDCIDTSSFQLCRKNSNAPFKYHVIFLRDDIKISWVTLINIKPFVNHKREDLVKRPKYRYIDYGPLLDKACELASRATKMCILQRLQEFSWIARKNNNSTYFSNDNSANQIQSLDKTMIKDTSSVEPSNNISQELRPSMEFRFDRNSNVSSLNMSDKKLSNDKDSFDVDSIDQLLRDDSWLKDLELEDSNDSFIPGTPETENENVTRMKLIIESLNENSQRGLGSVIDLNESYSSKISKDSGFVFENEDISFNPHPIFDPKSFESNFSSKKQKSIKHNELKDINYKRFKLDYDYTN